VVAGQLQPGDLIVAIDGQRIDSVDQVIGEIQALGRAGGPGMIEVLRGGERLALEVTPRQGKDGKGSPVADRRSVSRPSSAPLRHPPALRPPGLGHRRGTRNRAPGADSLGMMGRIVTGKASLQNVSGPVTIACVANVSAKRGLDWFLQFLALLSSACASSTCCRSRSWTAATCCITLSSWSRAAR
jgi:regulator of sigma E protease